MNGEHDAIAKTVINAAVVALQQHASFNQLPFGLRIAGKLAFNAVPLIRHITDTELFNHFTTQATALEVADGILRLA